MRADMSALMFFVRLRSAKREKKMKRQADDGRMPLVDR